MSEIFTKQLLQGLKPVGSAFPKSVPDLREKGWNGIIRKRLKSTDKTRPSLRGKVKKGRKVRKHLPSIKSLKLKADKFFSIFIRSRDNNKCVLCRSHKDIQCGHMIKRGKMSTRFSEVNCNALCSGCNYKDNFEPWHYTQWFVNKYGLETYSRLVLSSKILVKANRQFFLEIIKKYG